MAATDKFLYVGNPGTATTLSAPGYTIGNTSITVGSTANFPTASGVIFAIDTAEIVDGEEVQVNGTYCVFSGNVTDGTTISDLTLEYGTPQNYASGALTRVYIPISALHNERLIDGLLEEHKQNGQHSDINADSITATDGTITDLTVTNLTVGSQTPSADWTAIGTTPTTVTYNGQRSYSVLYPGIDLTNVIQPGTRLRTTRTVAAPDQCASLNGTNQFFNDTTVSGMTFTDDSVVGAWVKLNAYGGANATVIMSRYNGTSGWGLYLTGSGQVVLDGRNGGAANSSFVRSFQSIPLNKWVHVAAQLDMSAFTATTTTSYVMIDGVDVPAEVVRSGTNPTALVQAGNLEIGSWNGGTLPFPGKIAQAFVSSAKITQANVRTLISQGLTSALVTSNNIVSAFSLAGASGLTDINTTNANNLTAQNSAATTNADSPFGTQGNGTISSTLDYGIIQSATFSTDTTVVVQVPEGCTIPTSGGVSASDYSGLKAPYGFPVDGNKWLILSRLSANTTIASPTGGTWYNIASFALTVPAGAWKLSYSIGDYGTINSSSVPSILATLSTSPTTASDSDFITRMQSISPDVDAIWGSAYRSKYVPLSAVTPYYLNLQSLTNSATSIFIGFYGQIISAENTYL